LTDSDIGKTILREVCDQCGKPIFPHSASTTQARLNRPGFCNCALKQSLAEARQKKTDGDLPVPKKELEPDKEPAQSFNPAVEVKELVERGFTFLERIGKGSLAYVYQAKSNHAENFFAVKIFDRNLFENRRTFKRLEQEVQRAKEISHPNIAAVYEFGTAKTGYPYLVMDFLAGPSLSEIIANEGFLDVPRVVDITIQICDALQHAHEKGLLHRDLKPSNIYLLPATSGGDYVKLSDLGVAKALPNPGRETRYMTPDGEEFGNPSYMSPEQCLGERLTSSSDLYSLGCVMYESLSGKLPLTSSNPVRLAFKQVSEEPKNLHERFIDLDIPVALSDIVMTLLQKNIANRFASAKDLKDALIAYRDGKAIKKRDKDPVQKSLKIAKQIEEIKAKSPEVKSNKKAPNFIERFLNRFKKP
jgi:serine/threonine protein kinase